jgi:superfamily II DNA or RNA helicase
MQHRRVRAQLVECTAALLDSSSVQLPYPAYPYQDDTFGVFHGWLADDTQSNLAHVVHATGLGKTFVFSAIVAQCTGLRCLIIVPTRTLVEQTARSMFAFVNGRVGHVSSLGRVRGTNDEVVAVRGTRGHEIVVATYASFVRYADKLAIEYRPHLVVADECHLGYGDRVQRALRKFPWAVIVGFTATPDYLGTVVGPGYVPVTLENGQVLWGLPERFAETHFGKRLEGRNIRWGIEQSWLAPLAWGSIEFPVSLDKLPVGRGPHGMDYNAGALKALMAEHWKVMCEMIRRLYKSDQYGLADRQVYAVCPGVEQAAELAEVIADLGVPTASVTGSTPGRRDILDKFGRGEIRFLPSVYVLRDGWDAPNAEVCLMLRPTKSLVAYLQYMGRVLRTDKNNPRKVALVLDAHHTNTKLSPLSAPVLIGDPRERVRDGDIVVGPGGPGGPRKKKPVTSPYVSEGVTPRIVVVQALEIEHWAGSDRTFEADGETWGHTKTLADMIGVGDQTLAKEFKRIGAKPRSGRGVRGGKDAFYSLSDAQRACRDLVDRCKANSGGTFRDEGETWISAGAVYRRLGVSDRSILNRIKGGWTIRSRPGRNASGRRLTFYALSDVKKACADLLGKKVVKDAGPMFRADGETWGSAIALGGKLGVGEHGVRSRARATQVRTRKVKPKKGPVATYYCLSDLRRAMVKHPKNKTIVKSGQGGSNTGRR